jgi:aminoglycoside 6'-N-acetyltransferase
MEYLIQNGDISIRKMEDNISDYSLMAKWLSSNDLLDYYEGRSNVFDLEKVIKKFGPRAKGEETVVSCIIEHNEKPIGYIQYYCIDSNEYSAGNAINMKNFGLPYGMDLFIGEIDKWNRGIGTIVVMSMITYLFKNEKADILFIDPQTWNKRAIRCYEKSGFIPIVTIKNREMHDGEYMDSLIMSISFKEWENSYKQI